MVIATQHILLITRGNTSHLGKRKKSYFIEILYAISLYAITATDLGVEWRQIMYVLERELIDIECVLYDITKKMNLTFLQNTKYPPQFEIHIFNI